MISTRDKLNNINKLGREMNHCDDAIKNINDHDYGIDEIILIKDDVRSTHIIIPSGLHDKIKIKIRTCLLSVFNNYRNEMVVKIDKLIK